MPKNFNDGPGDWKPNAGPIGIAQTFEVAVLLGHLVPAKIADFQFTFDLNQNLCCFHFSRMSFD